MVRCLTDFSCWEIIAKLASLGTALIVLIAAIIALGAMWVQMHIARRRASIDFFLKTEMDKTVIDLYNKFKALEIRRPPTEAAYTSLTAARHWSVNTLGFEVITKAAPYGSTCLPLVGPCLITALSKAQSTRPGRLFLHYTKRNVHATANTPRCACGRSYTGPKK